MLIKIHKNCMAALAGIILGFGIFDVLNDELVLGILNIIFAILYYNVSCVLPDTRRHLINRILEDTTITDSEFIRLKTLYKQKSEVLENKYNTYDNLTYRDKTSYKNSIMELELELKIIERNLVKCYHQIKLHK